MERPQTDAASTERMRAFWDQRARENPMWFIHSSLDFANPDTAEFWRSGVENLDSTLGPFGVQIRPTDRVCEIGCGIGRITRAIASRAASVVGVDVSAEMVERGRQELSDVSNVQFVVGNGVDLTGLDDADFDAVYSFIVFQHIPDPAVTCAYIREIGRVLRPGGWTVFQVSEQPEIHDTTHWAPDTLRVRIGRLLRRRPKGCAEAQWLGSAVARADLVQALSDGGLVLDATDGDGTQYCLVHAHKPPA